MDIGIPKEKGAHEHRVALTPSGVKALLQQGARVWVEREAGVEAGYSDSDFERAGATTAYSREEIFARGELVVCIQPPGAKSIEVLRPGQIVVANWALPAARPEDFRALQEQEVTAIGLEVIENEEGAAPVRICMSEIAGRLAVTIGSGLLLNEFGGKGLLICGSPGVPPASLVILGAGMLGRAAAETARGIGAHVVVLDRDVEALRRVQDRVGFDVPTMIATRRNLEKALGFADLFLCAVAVHGERTPVLVTRDMLKLMKPRSVIMDLSIDRAAAARPRGRPTSRARPTRSTASSTSASPTCRPPRPGLDPGADQHDPALRRGDRRRGASTARSPTTAGCAGAPTPTTAPAARNRWLADASSGAPPRAGGG